MRWEANYVLLIEYIALFGTPPVTKTIYKNTRLGIWLDNQRRFYKNGKLSIERQALLISIGVVFPPSLDEQWKQKYQEVISFKEEHGRLPKYREPGSLWLNSQKERYKKGKLSPERYDLLIAIGVEFPPK